MPDMLTEDELESLWRLHEQADPAPWDVDAGSFEVPLEPDTWACIVNAKGHTITDTKSTTRSMANHALMAAARNALPRLLAEVRRLRAEVARRGGGDGG